MSNQSFNYQVGGSLTADAPSYIDRQSDLDYYDLLKKRKYCYVFNCRQMGKSSLLMRVKHKLQAEGIVCATIDPQKIGVDVTCEQWYSSTIRSLVGDLNLKNKFDLRTQVNQKLLIGSGILVVMLLLPAVAGVWATKSVNDANVKVTDTQKIAQAKSQKVEESPKNLEVAKADFQREQVFDALVKVVSTDQKRKALDPEIAKRHKTHTQMLGAANLLQFIDRVQEKKRFAHSASVLSVAFSPDGKTIATGSLDNNVKLWNLEGKELKTFKGHRGSVWSVAFSPDGKTIVTGSVDNNVKLWNLEGKELKTFKGHSDRVWSVAFSPDGKAIVTGSWDNTIKLWNLKGKELKTFKGHSDRVWSVAFSPDGKTIATGSVDNTIKLWNLKGKELKTFKGHSDSVLSVAFSPDGKTIVTGSLDKTVKLWNLEGKELKTFKGHSASVLSVAFSPDGKTIATGSLDKTVKLWNLEGKELKTFKGHSDSVRSVAFSPDGKTIVTGSLDKTIKLWNLEGQ